MLTQLPEQPKQEGLFSCFLVFRDVDWLDPTAGSCEQWCEMERGLSCCVSSALGWTRSPTGSSDPAGAPPENPLQIEQQTAFNSSPLYSLPGKLSCPQMPLPPVTKSLAPAEDRFSKTIGLF